MLWAWGWPHAVAISGCEGHCLLWQSVFTCRKAKLDAAAAAPAEPVKVVALVTDLQFERRILPVGGRVVAVVFLLLLEPLWLCVKWGVV